MNKLRKIMMTAARLCYKLAVFRVLLPAVYLLSAAGAVDPRRTVFIEVRRNGLSNSFEPLWRALTGDGRHDTELCMLGLGSCGALGYIKNCIRMARRTARARYVFINEGSTAFSCLPIRKGTTVIQTWHGCGAFKRVGMSAAGNGGNVHGGRLERRLFPMCRHMDFITISGEGVAWAYEEAFDLREGDGQRICPAGTPRTDVFFDSGRVARAAEEVRGRFPCSRGKKIILYAPTFRGETTRPVMPDALDIGRMREARGRDYILLIKHHPVIREKQAIPDSCADFAFDAGEIDSESLLMAADILVTDYSSILFDYSLLDRPIVLFVYDIEEYLDWRGLYYPFEQFRPGLSAKTTDELIDAIGSPDIFDARRMESFRRLHMSACDGHSTERVLALMDETPDKCKKR